MSCSSSIAYPYPPNINGVPLCNPQNPIGQCSRVSIASGGVVTGTPACNANVSGRVLTSDGRGLRNATVSITNSQGVSRTATTSSFGFFSFDNIATGDTYTIRVASRLYRYTPQTVQINDNLTLPDFVGFE